jgi:C4-dicarboxylate transporter DctM subunit
MSLLVLVGILLAVVLGLPLWVILGALASALYYFGAQESLTIVMGDIYFAADKEVLLAVPLFILAGQMMTKGSIARRLVQLAEVLTRKVPGGLGLAAVLSCGVFAAISGSSPVTLIAIGSLLYPTMIKAGWDRYTSMGLLSTGGTLGIIIPPSVPMIIFAIMAGVSVVDLFKAGIGPGLLLMLLLALWTMWKAPKISSSSSTSSIGLLQALRESIFSLLMPLMILGGIYGGFFTATESAAIAVLYAFVVELFIHREMTFSHIPEVFQETAKMLGLLFLLLVFSVSLNKYMTLQEIPQFLVEKLAANVHNQLTFMVLVNLLLLVVGCFMDIMSAILVLAPLLTPMAEHYGLNPIHFGIIMIVNLEIGYLTPPIGINLFVASGLFKTSLGEVVRSVGPYLVLMLIGLLLICVFPGISLGFL